MTARQVRLAVLVAALGVVAAWAFGVQRSRAERRRWDRTVEVAVVLVGPQAPPPATREALAAGLSTLEAQLAREAARYLPAGPPPFAFELLGPVTAPAPPLPPEEAGVRAALGHAWRLWRARRAIDAAVPGFSPRLYDIRLYLTLEGAGAASPSFAEGAADGGGEVALVHARAERGVPVLALQAIVHEALHCLWATDKYDAAGHALVPVGLADPERQPLFPQAAADVMGVEVAHGPGAGRLPLRVEELAIGPVTAAEIGWTGAGGR